MVGLGGSKYIHAKINLEQIIEKEDHMMQEDHMININPQILDHMKKKDDYEPPEFRS